MANCNLVRGTSFYTLLAVLALFGEMALAQSSTTTLPIGENSSSSAPANSTPAATSPELRGESRTSIVSPLNNGPLGRFTADYFNWTSFQAGDVYEGTGKGSGINRFGIAYKLNENETIGLKQPFQYNYQFANGSRNLSDSHTKDLYINYTNSEIFSLSNDSKFKTTSSRIYLPTGEDSRTYRGLNFGQYNWFAITQPLGHGWSTNLNVRTSYYNYYITAYINPYTGKIKGNQDLGLDVLPEIIYRFTPKLSFSHMMGPSVGHFLGGRAVSAQGGQSVDPKTVLVFTLWSQLDYQIDRNFDVKFAVNNDADLNPPTREFGFFNNYETVYNLLFSASI